MEKIESEKNKNEKEKEKEKKINIIKETIKKWWIFMYDTQDR